MKKMTIRVEFENKEDITWIYDSHKEQSVKNGVKVTAISTGDMFKQCDAYEKLVDFYEEQADTDYLDLDQEKFIKDLNEQVKDSFL